jgi:protein DEK
MASEALEEKKSEEEAPAAEESKPGAEKEQTENEGTMDSAENEAKEEADNEEVKGEEETAKEGAEKEESLGNEEKEEEAKDKGEEEVENKKSKRRSKKSSKNSTGKKVKELVTPSSDRPTRERKVVERYSVPEPGRSATKPFSIEKVRLLKSWCFSNKKKNLFTQICVFILEEMVSGHGGFEIIVGFFVITGTRNTS